MSGVLLHVLWVVLTLEVVLPGGWGLHCVGRGPCMCVFDDYSGTADLTTCGNTDGTAKFKDYTALYDAYVYSYNPCHKFTENGCTNAAMCQFDFLITLSWKTGDQSTTTWSYDGTNIQIYYYADTDTMRESFITAICDMSYIEPYVDIQGQISPGVAQYYGRITTKCACPDGCHNTTHFDTEVSLSGGWSRGWSGGWILIIIVLVLGFVCLVGGMLFMRFGKQSQGREMIPNLSFWSALPGLIKDGFAFTTGCIRGGGGGGSRSAYQNI